MYVVCIYIYIYNKIPEICIRVYKNQCNKNV